MDTIMTGESVDGSIAVKTADEYADGKAVQTWGQLCRTEQFRQWLTGVLRTNECYAVLDAACGTGVDSVLLIEEGFNVISVDASDQMVKYATQTRQENCNDPRFDQWIIKEGNWLTLVDDVAQITIYSCLPLQSSSVLRFDAVICIGNSFSHLPDDDGNMSNQRRAISNFIELLNPGGILVIDHRNFDEILRTGVVQQNTVSITTRQDVRIRVTPSTKYPKMLTFNYYTNSSSRPNDEINERSDNEPEPDFRLSYYPHRLDDFSRLLQEVCGPGADHVVYGDYRPLGEVVTPTYYTHVIKKSHEN